MCGVHPRTTMRIAVSIVTFAALLVWFHEPLFTLLDVLFSGEWSSGRRLTLALLAALSVFPPLILATALADTLFNRYLTAE